jgi:hypothetical protein
VRELCTGLADEYRLVGGGVAQQLAQAVVVGLVQAEVIGQADLVQVLGQAVLDTEVLAVDQAGRADQPGRVGLPSGLGKRAHEGVAGIGVGVLVAHAPQHHAGTVGIAAHQFQKLVSRPCKTP